MNLKEILKTHRISVQELTSAIKGKNGNPLSRSSMSLLVYHQIYPESMPRQEFDRQINDFLNRRGIHPATEHEVVNNMKRITLNKPILAHFKLFRTPFPLDFDSVEEVYQDKARPLVGMIVDTARLGGLLAIVGESGAGKTTLLRCAIDRLTQDEPQIRIIQLFGMLEEQTKFDKKPLSAKAITNAIIFSCSDETPRQDVECRTRQVVRILESGIKSGSEHLLIIDEAHLLHLQTLKSLKRFWDLQLGFKRLLRIVLVGQPELKTKLDENRNPDLRELIRRVELFELRPMNETQVRDYLATRWQSIGGQLEDTFTDDAYPAVIRALQQATAKGQVYSNAYPLAVNNLVSRAMYWVATTGKDLGYTQISAEVIDGNPEITRGEV